MRSPKKIIALVLFLSFCFVPLSATAVNLEKYNAPDMAAEKKANDFSFVVISDTPEGDDATQGESLIKSVEFLNEKKPAFIVLLGDLTANGKINEFDTLNEVFLKKVNAPIVPVAGNHDFIGGSKNWYNHFLKKYSSEFLSEYNSATPCGTETPGPRFRRFTYKGIGFALIDPYFDGHKYGLTQTELVCIDSQVAAGDLVFRHVTPYGLHCQENGKICGSSVLGIIPEGLKDIDQLPKKLKNKNIKAIFAAHTHGYYHGKCDGLEYINSGTLGLRAREYVKGWSAADIANSFIWVDVDSGNIKVTIYVYNPSSKTFAPQTKNFPATVSSQLIKSDQTGGAMNGVNATCIAIQPDGSDASSEFQTVKELKIVKPEIAINIPQLKFSDLENNLENINGVSYLNLPYIGEYMSAIYKVALVAISIIAVIMIIVEGVKIITIGGEARPAGFKKIGQVVIGLFIAWGSYTILYTINPDLVNFKALKIQYIVPQIEYDPSEPGGGGGAGETKRLCDNRTACAPYCSNKTSLPPYSTLNGADPAALTDVTKWFTSKNIPTNGLTLRAGALLKSEAIPALQAAGKNAADKGYILRVQSTYRSLEGQLTEYCKSFQAPDYLIDKPDKPFNPSLLSWPGGSNHGVGIAIDVTLLKNGTPVAGYAKKNEAGPAFEDLKSIMFGAGWIRLKSERWHYEFWGETAFPDTRCNNC